MYKTIHNAYDHFQYEIKIFQIKLIFILIYFYKLVKKQNNAQHVVKLKNKRQMSFLFLLLKIM